MKRTLRILDLFCCAGGAAKGYDEAFTDAGYGVDITGVDIVPQPNYPYAMRVGDANTWPLDGYDFIHASPPCQDFSIACSKAKIDGKVYGTGWMLNHTYQRLKDLSIPWVIENVATARRAMQSPIMLCGSMFDLNIVRHRLFDSNFYIPVGMRCKHTGKEVTVCGHGAPSRARARLGYNPNIEEKRDAMGIAWTNRDELSQAIPPAYTRYIGNHAVRYFESPKEIGLMAYTKKNTTPATKEKATKSTKPKSTHNHRAGSVCRLSDGMTGYTWQLFGDVVSVWTESPSDERFFVCRVCGKSKPVFGRPHKVAPTEATTCGGVERIVVAERPSLFGRL